MKKESRQNRKEEAEKKRAAKSLKKEQNLTKLQKLDLNFTAKSDSENFHSE